MDFIYDPSLVLYLPLYELDGASFMSKDKHGHLCTVTGAVWRPNGHYFDGTDDYINCGAPSVLDFTSQDFTVEAWLKRVVAQNSDIYCHGLYSADGYRLFLSSAGSLQLNTNQSGAHQDSISADGEITNDVWFHIVATRLGTTGKVYKNGTDITSTGASHIDPTTSSRNVYIGQYDLDSQRFGGYIGEVRVYNRALTPTEIQYNYLATKWRYR